MNSFPAASQLISCIGRLSNTAIDKLLKIALDMVDTENTTVICCPYCGGTHFVRNGKKHGKQHFLCKSCDSLKVVKYTLKTSGDGYPQSFQIKGVA